MKKLTFLVIIIIAAGFITWGVINRETKNVVTNFEECVAANNPVMESYPRQCISKKGDHFTENIGNELEEQDIIQVDSPRPNTIISSPLVITGQARGNWFFEASFPVKIFDSEDNLLGLAIAQAESDWMTSSFVPFTAILKFTKPATDSGYLLFERDNPSGLIENAGELKIPINFEVSSVTSSRPVKLYYYNSKQEDTGSCGEAGLVAVDRQMTITKTPIQDTINLLLQGDLLPAEIDSGLTTEFPLAGLSLVAASLTNGNLTLTFDDPSNRTTGGSCRIAMLWSQISATAKQFPEVKSVNFLPEELFQP